jgi:hypothetical protein
MSGIKFWNGDENLRPVLKKPFYEKLVACLHFGLKKFIESAYTSTHL